MSKKVFKHKQILDHKKQNPDAKPADIQKALGFNLQYIYKVLADAKKSPKKAKKIGRPRKVIKEPTYAIKEPTYAIIPTATFGGLNGELAEKDEQIRKLNHVIQYLEQRLYEYRGVTV